MSPPRAPAQQTILITGATDGLGRALASELASAGATLLVHARDETRGGHAIAELDAAAGARQLPRGRPHEPYEPSLEEIFLHHCDQPAA
jgi:NAD(P)-dependent dehydrogenase (short-subunit alcohol dehydrogenase family)